MSKCVFGVFLCLFVFFSSFHFFNLVCVLCIFCVFFTKSCYVFSVFYVFSFLLLQIAFSSIFPLVFLWCFLFFPIINFFPLLQKFHFCHTYSMCECPFLFFSLFIFCQPFFLLILFLFLVFLWAILLFWLLNTFLVLSSKFCSLVSRRCFPLCRILFYYVMEQLFLIATRGIFTSFRIQPNQIEEISPSFLFLLFNGMTNPPAIAFYTKLH